MTSTVRRTASTPASDLEEVRALYSLGRYHDAFEAGEALGELRAWSGADARIMAARMAARLGAPRLSQALVFHAHRADPRDAEGAFYYASLMLHRRGPWHALRWLRRARPALTAERADLLALEAQALAMLRDFDRAHPLMESALARDPEAAWLHVQRSVVLELEDRFDDALAAIDDALAIAPRYRPSLHRRAHLLSSLGRREAARECLVVNDADQSWELLSHRAEVAFSLGAHGDCSADLERARAAALFAEPKLVRELAARQAEAAYLTRRHRKAEAFAREAGDDLGRAFAESLAKLPEGAAPPRVELSEVPHVRQHHVTCAPASLASITAYHGDPIDHLEIADAICYAGTPVFRQREWAEARGYVVRELDVTLEATRALIDAGFPFVLGTASTVSSHAQVVIGYDLARRSLLIRDPSINELVELRVDSLFEKQAWHGPHGLVLAPRSRADALDSLDLPAVDLCAHRHELALALERHDVDAARRAADAIEAAAPGSRHGWDARLAIALYEKRTDEQRDCLDALLALHPDTPAWVLRRGEAMRGRTPRADQLAFWERYVHLDDPPLLEAMAEELRFEHERRDDAARLLRRALRLQPRSAMAHHVLADLEASRGGDPEDTLESYRFGALLGETTEHFARAYFDHARLLGRDEEALALLERRVKEAAGLSAAPARTLFEVYLDQGNPERGRAVLEALAEARPDDGDLRLLLVDACLDAGDPDDAERWLERAEALPAREDERVAATVRLARTQGRLTEAREHLARAHRASPERIDWLVELAHTTSELEGEAAGLACLEAAHAARPDDPAVLTELCVWLRRGDDARALRLLDDQLERHPHDGWAERERALVLARLDRLDEAIDAARATTERRPHDSVAFGILGSFLSRRGELEEARRCFRRAVEIDVDDAEAIRMMASSMDEPERRREDARFVLDRLEERVSGGAGLIEAAHFASVLPHEERTARLERLLERSPHRPDAWEATIRARMQAGEIDAADDLARKALRRFPRWRTLRLLRADLLRAKGQPEAAEAALRELVALAPTWPEPRIALAWARRERGELDDAIAVIDEGLRRAPRHVPLRYERARLVWAQGDREAAFEALLALVRDAFTDDPSYDLVCAWARTLGREEEVEALVREQIDAHPAQPSGHVRLGLLLTEPERLDEHVAALREALRLHPRHQLAADVLAESLALAGRFEEAIEACPPPTWIGPVPVPVRGRRAWVIAQRGDREEAIDAMLAILEEDPSYAWGRRNVCDWLEALERNDAFLAQAGLLVAEAPTVGLHHVFLGDARLRTGDREGARDAFARAVQLAPGNGYAASRLCELALVASDFDAARETLERVRHSIEPAELESLVARVEAAAGQDDEALAALDRLIALPAPQAILEATLDELLDRPIADAALCAVEDALADPEPAAGRALAFAWARVRERRAPRGALRILKRRDELGAVGRLAVGLLIEALARQDAWWRLGWTWLRHRRWLRADDQTWASFGFALYSGRWVGSCRRWLADWRERPSAKPWMLFNLFLALWIGKRGRGARDVLAGGLALPPDHTRDRYRRWAAFYRALDGDAEGARAELATAPTQEEDEAEGLAALVAAMSIDASMGPGVTLRDWTEAIRPSLEEAAARATELEALRAPYDVVVSQLLKRFGVFRRWWLRIAHLPKYQP